MREHHLFRRSVTSDIGRLKHILTYNLLTYAESGDFVCPPWRVQYPSAVGVIKAKFHYAILVADRSAAGRRPVADLLARASSLLAS